MSFQSDRDYNVQILNNNIYTFKIHFTYQSNTDHFNEIKKFIDDNIINIYGIC